MSKGVGGEPLTAPFPLTTGVWRPSLNQVCESYPALTPWLSFQQMGIYLIISKPAKSGGCLSLQSTSFQCLTVSLSGMVPGAQCRAPEGLHLCLLPLDMSSGALTPFTQILECQRPVIFQIKIDIFFLEFIVLRLSLWWSWLPAATLSSLLSPVRKGFRWPGLTERLDSQLRPSSSSINSVTGNLWTCSPK